MVYAYRKRFCAQVERRPADVIGATMMAAKIATGEIEDTIPDDGKAPPRRRTRMKARQQLDLDAERMIFSVS